MPSKRGRRGRGRSRKAKNVAKDSDDEQPPEDLDLETLPEYAEMGREGSVVP